MRTPLDQCRRRSAANIIRTMNAINRTRALTAGEVDTLYQAIRDERRRPSQRGGTAQHEGA